MSTFTLGSLSCTSVIFGEPNLAAGADSLMPARHSNLEQTLKDLELMKKKCLKSKSTSDINCASTSQDRRNSKTVRFENIGNNQIMPKTCTEEQIYQNMPFQMEYDMGCMNNRILRKTQSDSQFQNRKTANKNSNETGNANCFNKLKKFWQGLSGKRKSKKSNIPRRFLTMDDSDSKFSETSKSLDYSSSCTESLKSETSGYITSKPQDLSSFLEAGESDNSFNEIIQNFQKCSLSNFSYPSQFGFPVEEQQCSVDKSKNKKDKKNSKNVSRPKRWEPYNGFNDLPPANQHNCDACTPEQLDNTFGNNCPANNEIQTCSEMSSNHSSCNDINSYVYNLSPQTSTETLVENCSHDCCSPSLSEQSCKGSGFLNSKKSPICCSLESYSTSCRDSANDTKNAIRSLKNEMTMRKKMQKQELKQLKEKMKFLKRNRSRKSGSSGSSSFTSSMGSPDCTSLRNLLEASGSSYSVPYYPSDKNFRTVTHEAYRESIPYQENSKCSQLKQQYSIKTPMWSQPVLRQKQSVSKSAGSATKAEYFEQPYKNYYPQQPNCSRYHMPSNATQKIYHEDYKPHHNNNDNSCDPTRLLWKEILLNTPCDISNANESIITCYVTMYRKQAADALTKRKCCILDPLEFRYGYQNGLHKVNRFKKDDTKVVWNCKKFGTKNKM